MKKSYSLFVLILCTSLLHSQNWVNILPQDKAKAELNFYDYRTAFDTYWAPFNVVNGYYDSNGNSVKASGWKQFMRWEYNMQSQIDPSTGSFPKQTAQQVVDAFEKQNAGLRKKSRSNSANASNWKSLGPNSSEGGYAGVGRINCVAFHPDDNNTYWVGAASGGLWMTTDNGVTWVCMTDKIGVLAISDIIIPSDYASTKTIYIATGDRDWWDNRSIGVLKSTDGGVSWNDTGLSFILSSNQMVNKLLIDPSNNQSLIAATTNGVYKTTNGGLTWDTRLTDTEFIDLEFKPTDFSTLYGSTKNGRMYLSTNAGAAWTLAFIDISSHRIELAVSPNQPTVVYAIAVATDNGLYGIYKSTDSGATYTKVFSRSTKNLLGYSSTGIDDSGYPLGQGYYDLCIAVSPTDANTLLIGGINSWRSIDGGTTWSLVNHWTGGGGAQSVHADKHGLEFRADGSLFECNDGGIYRSTNNGTLWTDITTAIAISQMYKLGVSKTVPNEVITGLQDNGTKLLSGNTWSDVKSGDGMECLIDYTDVNVQYGSYVNGQITRTTDHWTNYSNMKNIQPTGAGDGAWVTPYIIDPVDNKTLYAGYADIWKTTDMGTNWTKISSFSSSNKFSSMAVAPSNNQVLYVSDSYNIWKTTNGGTQWVKINGTLPLSNNSITYITVKNDDPNTLWVTMGQYNTNRVFQSVNGGTNWTNISAGLPSIPAYTIVQNEQSTTELQLFVGTELGIYFKTGNASWIPFNTNLPNVRIGEIELQYASNPIETKLKAATYGRGLWESPVYYNPQPMTYVSSTTTQGKISSIAPNSLNQNIIRVEILTDGNLSALNVSSFTFNTIGSTDPTTDIANAKLYSTGSSDVFNTNTRFGSTAISPNGSFTFSGSQTLTGGTNYFWLTYDIPTNAVLDNLLDAQCTSLTVGTAKTPTITNPVGNIKITNLNYCAAGASNTYESISNVSLGTINQQSSVVLGNYQDFTSQITNMQIGVATNATITLQNPYSSDIIKIWADWNRDGDFEDVDELIYTSTGTLDQIHTTSNFMPPTAAKIGKTLLRIRLFDSSTSYTPNATPCGNSGYGEVEDYTINVTAPFTYNVKVPVGTMECYISGTMNGWKFQPMTKVNATQYETRISSSSQSDTYKYCSGPNWIFVEKDLNLNDISNRNYSSNDVVAAWASTFTDVKTISAKNLILTSGKSFIKAQFNGMARVEVYTLSGLLIKQSNATDSFVANNLTQGLYIVKINGLAYKIIVN